MPDNEWSCCKEYRPVPIATRTLRFVLLWLCFIPLLFVVAPGWSAETGFSSLPGSGVPSQVNGEKERASSAAVIAVTNPSAVIVAGTMQSLDYTHTLLVVLPI